MLHNDGDKSTSNHDVTVNGDPQLSDTAKFGQSAVFDGTGDYLTIPDSDDFDFGSGDFTFDFWVYPEANGYVFTHGANSMPVSYILYQDNDIIFSSQASGYSGQYWISGNLKSSDDSVVLNTWNHVAIVRNSGLVKLYINGEEKDSRTPVQSNYIDP